MKILATGGAGYIGSHATLQLLSAGVSVIVLDNFCNSSGEAVSRVTELAGKAPILVEGDVRDKDLLDRIFKQHAIDAVIHFAGLKAVGESVLEPLRYYNNNVYGSQVLLQAMADAGVFKFIYSSSATIYGEPADIPISETCPVGEPTNPYGRGKLMVENILRDLAFSDRRWGIAILRYFNPVGSHESGMIGEDPNGIPNNLLPFIAKVAIGELPELEVFGADYPTPDGTGIRDYIHVEDLVSGHLRAIERLSDLSGIHVWNLGTGQGFSVLEIIRAFEAASGKTIKYRLAPRRVGDIAICFADPRKAEYDLSWKAVRGLSEMMRDAWHWHSKNPYGYKG